MTRLRYLMMSGSALASGPTAVEIVGHYTAVTAEIRNRAREEAILAHAGASEDPL